MPWLKHDYQRFFPSLTWQASPQLPRVLREAGARVVDLGAGGRQIAEGVVCVDFVPYPGTSVVADVERLPFRDGSVDLVIGTGLLEHVQDDRAVLRETFRVLRPGGRAHFEVPFLQQHHDDPIDHRRFTVAGLESALTRAGLQPERAGAHIGPTVTLVTLAAYYLALVLEGRSVVLRALSTAAFFLASLVLWPLKFLDRLLIGKRSAQRLAFGVYVTARKPGALDPP